ncbi:hypothetical protein [Gemella sanguinis]|uniref:hypothetical protein n=1 Tax=Gemella sanguinis TaxID=84135 RepID=UPI0026F3543A|nr:hypothetical protein [Gemella sanguinis]
MAIRNKNGLLVSYPCEELIQDVTEDIFLFGESYKVYAVWQRFDVVDGIDYNVNFIVDYVDYEKPAITDFLGDHCDIFDKKSIEDSITYEQLLDDYRRNLKSIENVTVELMTAKELLEKLLLQNSIF